MQENYRISDKWNRDRRAGLRFPIDSALEYKVLRQGRVLDAGQGRTVNISSSGVLFESDARFAPGATMELSIAWPARLGGAAPIQLYLRGRAVRVAGGITAVRIVAYDFRTKARAANATAKASFGQE